MAKIKKDTDKEVKRLGLFDHISAVTEYQDPQYWKKISDDDKKTFGNFIKTINFSNIITNQSDDTIVIDFEFEINALVKEIIWEYTFYLNLFN